MFPFVFEWQWDIGHFIFMGLFYLALMVIGCGLIFTFIKTLLNLKNPTDH